MGDVGNKPLDKSGIQPSGSDSRLMYANWIYLYSAKNDVLYVVHLQFAEDLHECHLPYDIETTLQSHRKCTHMMLVFKRNSLVTHKHIPLN